MSDVTPTPQPRVAVVTVSYGSGEVLAPFLESLGAAAATAPVVVVADNLAGTESSVENQVRAHGADYLPMSHNAGYGGGINAAARRLPDSIEWILVANPDVVLAKGSLDSLVATGDADPFVGAVGPAILSPMGQLYPSARAIPSLRTGIGHALFANLWLTNPWTREYRDEGDSPRSRRAAGWLSGACVLVRRDLFDQLGGFDENYFMYFEDVDLGYRIGQAGMRNIFEPDAEVTHSGAHSTAENSRAMVRVHHASAQRFLTSKYSGPRMWPVRAALRIGLSIRSHLVHGRLG